MLLNDGFNGRVFQLQHVPFRGRLVILLIPRVDRFPRVRNLPLDASLDSRLAKRHRALVFEAAKSDFEDFFDESSSPHAPDDAFNPRLLVVDVVVVFVQNFVVPASNTSTCVPPWYIENIVVVLEYTIKISSPRKMLTFFPADNGCFRSNLSLPEVKVCVFYMRASCLLSQQQRKKLFFFVVIRTFLLLEIDVFITARVFPLLMDEMQKKRNMCRQMCKRTVARNFIGLGFFRPDYAERMQSVCKRYKLKKYE